MRYSVAVLLALFTVCSAISDPFQDADYLWRQKLEGRLAKLRYKDLTKYLTRKDSLTSVGSVSTTSCNASCNALNAVLPGKVSFVEGANNASSAPQVGYWSMQQATTFPACRVVPTDAHDVGSSLIVAEFYGCPFAVKSGGHGTFAGTSSIADGITIDLSGLNGVTVSADSTFASVGPANTWLDVYNVLDPLNMTVVGSRVADIGVGGMALGGGTSFLSAAQGWACDNVMNYEVVLSDGQILTVNSTSYPDLFWALRGGGNNFGIVTRFDLETYSQGPLWAGISTYEFSEAEPLFDAFENFANDVSNDTKADLTLRLGYEFGLETVYVSAAYSTPVENPSIFDDFSEIKAITSSQRVTTVSQMAREINATGTGSGFRQSFRTTTFKNSASLMKQIFASFQNETARVSNSSDIAVSLEFQPISSSFINSSAKNGGNALGLATNEGPLTLLALQASWVSEGDDSLVEEIISNIVSQAVISATSMGLDHPFIYQNFASSDQDVFAGYGAANKESLLEISRIFDSSRTMQTYEPGYFKLGQ